MVFIKSFKTFIVTIRFGTTSYSYGQKSTMFYEECLSKIFVSYTSQEPNQDVTLGATFDIYQGSFLYFQSQTDAAAD
jgi:hypothetical protein